MSEARGCLAGMSTVTSADGTSIAYEQTSDGPAVVNVGDEMENAELVVVPESVMHRPDPVATARVVKKRLG